MVSKTAETVHGIGIFAYRQNVASVFVVYFYIAPDDSARNGVGFSAVNGYERISAFALFDFYRQTRTVVIYGSQA